ncbi:MAG: hypothetical protein ACK58L_01845 [Planctomycetota bacterium]
MSQGTPSDLSVSAATKSPSEEDQSERVFLVSYPKIVFLYPTVVTAILCSIFMWAKGGIPQDEVHASIDRLSVTPKTAAEPQTESSSGTAPAASQTPAASPAASTYHHNCARLFLIVFAINMVVISFDFPRTTSLTWFFAISALVIGLWFLFTMKPGLAPRILDGLLSIKPAANSSFYMIYAIIMLGLYVWVLISRRFDYWEVKGNELLHHHGFLSNLERFSAPNLRIDKEINDLFEYILLGSGRLIIHCSNERRAIVLENVLRINKMEERITKMLGALQVRVSTDKS